MAQKPDSKSNGDLKSDIAHLASLLSQSADSEEVPDGSNLAKMLEQLNSADGIAQGVEGKLDNLLQNLDSLLASLEKKEQTPTDRISNEGINGTGK